MQRIFTISTFLCPDTLWWAIRTDSLFIVRKIVTSEFVLCRNHFVNRDCPPKTWQNKPNLTNQVVQHSEIFSLEFEGSSVVVGLNSFKFNKYCLASLKALSYQLFVRFVDEGENQLPQLHAGFKKQSRRVFVQISSIPDHYVVNV